MFRCLAFLLVILTISGCAQRLPDNARIPLFQGNLRPQVAVGITDHRTFILNGNKKEWFEGITRGAFGIPMSLQRPGPEGKKSFALYLSGMIKASFEKAGSKVTVVKLKKGRNPQQAVAKVTNMGQAGLIILLYKSRYHVGFIANYQYDFMVFVADKNGKVKIRKSFSDWDKGTPLSAKYTVFDMHTEIYKNKLDKIINDSEIQQALSGE
jgi:hypothetical protein